MMEEAASGRVELRIPRQAQFVRVARLAACALAAQLDFTYDVVKDIELAVAEACTNAVEHAVARPAGGRGKAAPAQALGAVADDGCDEIVVRFASDSQQLVVEVIDRGQGFDPRAVEELELEGERLGGLGLMVIRQVMDEVDIECDEQTGTCVRMVKYRAREGR